MADIVLWSGAGMALLGLAGVIWCILKAVRLRRAARQGADPGAALRQLVALNMGSVALAFLGMGVMVVGMAL